MKARIASVVSDTSSAAVTKIWVALVFEDGTLQWRKREFPASTSLTEIIASWGAKNDLVSWEEAACPTLPAVRSFGPYLYAIDTDEFPGSVRCRFIRFEQEIMPAVVFQERRMRLLPTEDPMFLDLLRCGQVDNSKGIAFLWNCKTQRDLLVEFLVALQGVLGDALKGAADPDITRQYLKKIHDKVQKAIDATNGKG